MVDGTGAVVNRYQYDAFGNTVEAVEKVQNRFRYAGEQYDQVTGQYYLRARFYNPVVGRFTQEDTYRGDGLNLYSYVQNNPVNYYDPSGYSSCSKKSCAYVFYLPEWENEAKDDQKRLAAYYGIKKDQVILVPVTKAEELTKGWNNMGTVKGKKVDIAAVVINTHANSDLLALDSNPTKDNQLFDASDISALDNKDVGKLILYGCNGGHLDNKNNNPAAEFAKKVKGAPVLASDGTVYSHKRWLGLGSMEYESKGDSHFKDQRPSGSKRGNQGWVVYKFDGKKVSTSKSLGKKLTLSQMLSKMK